MPLPPLTPDCIQYKGAHVNDLLTRRVTVPFPDAAMRNRALRLLLDRHGRTVGHVLREVEDVVVLQADAAVTYVLAYR